ncbi:nuclear transport factor 2 family protein [Rhodocytophaga aerolata]|uniref:Nuclear transport factor 2 family protein n=1 Tax=Rhodocytophaga aerolata TaxID=455078 RepID=A0ABT8RFY6_9BACT|nr:nuclear transport factor 2 family protein [Rhodocytophaga aerolata]MDO1449710.1 nuclear transport factor 2 family protein [Rhodocytophaga aerolata]
MISVSIYTFQAQLYQSLDLQQVLTDTYKKLNALDIAEFTSYLADDIEYTLGCIAKGKYKQNLIETLRQLFAQVTAIKYEILHSYQSGNSVVVEMEVTYERIDQSDIIISGVIFLKIEDELVNVLKVYKDFTPLLG